MGKKAIKIVAAGAAEDTEAEIESKSAVLIKAEFEAAPVFKLTQKEDYLAIIEKRKAECEKLVINGVEDKAGYDAVVAAMGEAKKTRTTLVNAAKDIVIGPAKKVLAEYEDALDAIANALKEIENPLREKKNFIDAEKIRLKEEAELKKVQAMQARINDINVLGAMFDGVNYTFAYNPHLVISAKNIKDDGDEVFADFLEDVKTSWTIEQDRLKAEEQRLIDEENERLMKQNELDKQAAANAEESRKLNERRTAIRIKELKLYGAFQENNIWYINSKGNACITHEDVMEDSDETWEEYIAELDAYVAPEPEVGLVENEPAVTDGMDATSLHIDEHSNVHEDDWLDYEKDLPVITTPPVVQYMCVTLAFDIDKPWKDFAISQKMFMRIFPVGTGEHPKALEGVESIANSGDIDGLGWAIIPK